MSWKWPRHSHALVRVDPERSDGPWSSGCRMLCSSLSWAQTCGAKLGMDASFPGSWSRWGLWGMALAHPPPHPPKGKAAIGPDWVGEGLVGMRQNGTHVGQVLETPAQGLH